MGLRIDHVVWGAGDLDEAAGRLLERYGLGSVPGGRHPGWGTANRIVPLGRGYLELMAVVDPEEAARDPVGRALSRLLEDGDGLLMWCLATDDLDSTASRLGLAIQSKSRVLPDGARIGWRLAGLEVALREPWLPFFISWEVPPERHPGRMPVAHTALETDATLWASVLELRPRSTSRTMWPRRMTTAANSRSSLSRSHLRRPSTFSGSIPAIFRTASGFSSFLQPPWLSGGGK